MAYLHKLIGLITLCTIAVFHAACVDQPDDEASDEIAREVAREVDDIEIGRSEIRQASAVSFLCSSCIWSQCPLYCSPEMRYRFAGICYAEGRCTFTEYEKFRPRYQTP